MITKEAREKLKNDLLAKAMESAKRLGRIPSMSNFVIDVLECEALCTSDDYAELGFAEAMNVIYTVRSELHYNHGFEYTLSE